MGSDESHYNVSVIVRGKVTRQCPQTTTCEEKGEPHRLTELPQTTRAFMVTASESQLTPLVDSKQALCTLIPFEVCTYGYNCFIVCISMVFLASKA